MTTDPVLLDVADGVARLTLASPATGNAIGRDLAAALRRTTESLVDRTDVRAVLLGAEGRAFCVGGDLGYFAAHREDAQPAVQALVDDLHGALLALAALDAPVVARVQGAAAGAGMSLVCVADIAIAGAGASFTVAYTAVGLSPDGGSTWLLPRLVGLRRACELMLTNRRLSAPEALAAGILSEVVPDEHLADRADEVAGRLAAGPTPAFGAVKRLLRASATAGFEDQLRAEGESIAALAAAPSGREGVAAFLEKRPAEFR
jgi:2-(1,2-epoxy-1,2-dihydrophenyl)acetyl-CoA isomerase